MAESNWGMAETVAWNARHGVGMTRKSSFRTKADKTEDRPYGGRQMSVSRLKAYGPTRQHVAQRTADITM